MTMADENVVIYGAGAVGSCVGGWLAPHHAHLFLLARGEHARAMQTSGLTLLEGRPPKSHCVAVRVVDSLDAVPSASVVILAVKTYDLEAAAGDVKHHYGDAPLVVGLQNGLVNQQILPRYFSHVAYGVVWFSAWRPQPGSAGYKDRGPISLGLAAPDPLAAPRLQELNALFSLGFQSEIAGSFEDAVHTKLVLNLTNSLFTLVGLNHRPITQLRLLKKLTVGMLCEGIAVVEADGFREYLRGDNPSWRLLKWSTRLPEFVTDRMFKSSTHNHTPNSMAQDILQHAKTVSEIDALNDYFVSRARELGIQVPFIETISELCHDLFGRPGFRPVEEAEVWRQVQNRMDRQKGRK